jgi:excisionase family DNA binding protein
MEPLCVSVRDACRAVGISRSSLYVEIKAGRLRLLKRGTRSLIPAEDLREWVRRLPVRDAGRAPAREVA